MNRNYLLTLNNPTDFAQDYLQKIHETLKAQYTVGQLEKGEQGTPHIQFFMNFKAPVRPTFLKKFDNKLHIEAVKRNNGADDYCMKKETRLEGPFEYGVKPVRRDSKADWEEVKQNAIKGQLDKIPSDIFVRHYSSLKQIAKDHQVMVNREQARKCYWYWGPSGCGKTRSATEAYPNAYMKLSNKWWDGY